ncbi:MAG: DUF4382 domain-containing protein [Chloroflexota bacterium]
MMRKLFVLLVLIIFSVSLVMAQDDVATGTLEFRANGEDFVREGFVSKDGWTINFDHVWVSLSNVRAHQTNPPYDPFAGELTRSVQMVGLSGQLVVDLAEGDADADTILIGTVEDAPEGFYNAVAWMMTPADEGEIEGYSVVIDGTAEKDGETIDFTMRIEENFTYTCGAFVGDERKGVLPADATGDVELTFHFDHIFGDAETPLEDSLNAEAPGFDMFASLATDGVVDVSLSDLEMSLSEEDYLTFINVLPSLGHTGEGHCFEKALEE